MLRPRPPRRPARAVIAGLLISLAGVAAAAPAVATDTTPGFAQYQRAQAKVDFTVYAPTTPVTVPFDSLHRFACGGDRGAFINVNYGSQAARADQWIGLIESPGTVGCSDGPDGVGPAATFMVNGARARVLGACAGNVSQASKQLNISRNTIYRKLNRGT